MGDAGAIPFAGARVVLTELRPWVSARVAAIASTITKAKTCHIRMRSRTATGRLCAFVLIGYPRAE